MDHVYIAVVSQNYAVDVPHQDIPDTDLSCIVKTYHDRSPFPHVVTAEDLQAERLTGCGMRSAGRICWTWIMTQNWQP